MQQCCQLRSLFIVGLPPPPPPAAPATPATPAEGPSSDAASLAKLGSASSASFRRVDSASIKESVSAGSADLRTASVQGDSPRS